MADELYVNCCVKLSPPFTLLGYKLHWLPFIPIHESCPYLLWTSDQLTVDDMGSSSLIPRPFPFFCVLGTCETRAQGIFPRTCVLCVPSACKDGEGLGTRLGSSALKFCRHVMYVYTCAGKHFVSKHVCKFFSCKTPCPDHNIAIVYTYMYVHFP